VPERFISLFKCDPKPEKYAGDYSIAQDKTSGTYIG
jgi:hypothetical protein